jgi:hypothetical protein
MVTFVRNLTGVKKLRPPKAAAARTPKAAAGTRGSKAGMAQDEQALDRGARIPTRELKVLIAVSESFLACPVKSQTVDAKTRRAMAGRLAFMQKELAARDARDNRPLSAGALAAKLAGAATATSRVRVSVKQAAVRKPVDVIAHLMRM